MPDAIAALQSSGAVGRWWRGRGVSRARYEPRANRRPDALRNCCLGVGRRGGPRRVVDAMIIETRAVPPFQKNGFVVACETTREAVLIDPGDEVDMLLDVVARQSLKRAKHSADACARRSRNGGPAREARRCRFLCTCTATISFSTTPRLSRPRSSGCTAMSCRQSIAITISRRRCRSAITKSRSITRPDIVPAASVWRLAGRGRRKTISSSAIRCSPARSAEPICRAAIIPTLIRSITQVLFAFGDTARVHSGHGPQTTIGQERRTNPFLGRSVRL